MSQVTSAIQSHLIKDDVAIVPCTAGTTDKVNLPRRTGSDRVIQNTPSLSSTFARHEQAFDSTGTGFYPLRIRTNSYCTRSYGRFRVWLLASQLNLHRREEPTRLGKQLYETDLYQIHRCIASWQTTALFLSRTFSSESFSKSEDLPDSNGSPLLFPRGQHRPDTRASQGHQRPVATSHP